MIKFLAIISFLTVNIFCGFAQNYTVIENRDAFLKLYKEKAKTILTLKSKFVQEKSISFLEKNLVSEGIFYYKMPSKLRMEYIKPYSYLFILNNDKVIIRSNNTETNISTTTNRIFKIISQITLDCVSGNVFNNKDFTSTIKEDNSSFQITLVPKLDEIESILDEIIVIVSKTDYTVEKVTMLESSGDSTILLFKEKEMNKNISDASFAGN